MSAATILKLEQYTWPGNIRELQNVLERTMIMSNGSEIIVDLEERAPTIAPSPAHASDELAAVARAHILHVLEDCRWVIAGPRGAAARLGMKRTTLNARLKKFGIARGAESRYRMS